MANANGELVLGAHSDIKRAEETNLTEPMLSDASVAFRMKPHPTTGAFYPESLPELPLHECHSTEDSKLDHRSSFLLLFHSYTVDFWTIPHGQLDILSELYQVLEHPRGNFSRMNLWRLIKWYRNFARSDFDRVALSRRFTGRLPMNGEIGYLEKRRGLSEFTAIESPQGLPKAERMRSYSVDYVHSGVFETESVANRLEGVYVQSTKLWKAAQCLTRSYTRGPIDFSGTRKKFLAKVLRNLESNGEEACIK